MSSEDEMLLRVITPHWTAGAVFINAHGERLCVRSAPICAWMKGMTWYWIQKRICQWACTSWSWVEESEDGI